ncbi:MAG TPA: TonB family protein [Gemmatirosa sp.]
MSLPSIVRHLPRLAAVACLALALPARSISAQTPAVSGLEVVSGTIRGANHTGVVGAQVTVTPVAARGGAATGPARVTISDDDGHFRIPWLPRGPVTVAVRRIGFQALSLDTTAAGLPALNITLVPVAQRLAAVVVNARSRHEYKGPLADFNRRRDLGFGHFVTATDIDERHPIRTTDMLRTIPGVMVYTSGPFSGLRLRNANCSPLVWLDGMPALSGYLDIDAFDPMSFAGIEIYTGVSTVPVELRGARGEESCGVIALWTRMPELRPKNRGHTYTAEDLARLVDAATVYTADQVDRPAHLDSTATLAVSYPDSLRNTHTPGEATVEFVVDTTGAVEAGTVGVVTASHPRFADAARAAASDARFIPAERAGHTVRQLVQLPLRWEAGR